MTGLTPHLAHALVEDRLRGAAHTRVVRSAEDQQAIAARRRVVAAAAEGDQAAWALLQDRYTKRVRNVVRGYRLSPHDVDDIVQTTWLRLVEHIAGLRDAEAVGAWLETTARRECLTTLRRRKRETPTDVASLAEQPCEPVAERRLVAAARTYHESQRKPTYVTPRCARGSTPGWSGAFDES